MIAVVYLCRDLENKGYIDAFLDSYSHFRAGVPHHLSILLKGKTAETKKLTKFLQKHGDSVSVLRVPDEGFDIGSYVYAAKRLNFRIFCFLNSYSRILAPNWLNFLTSPILKGGASLTGCTGSWESFSTTMMEEGLPFAIEGWPNFPQRLADFPRFPNPHIRTTAFCISRKDFLKLKLPKAKTKVDCWLIESGSDSITRQIQRQKRNVFLVGKNGKVYLPHLWSASEIFRVPGQKNLLIADNQTDNYDDFPEAYQLKITASTWLPVQRRRKNIAIPPFVRVPMTAKKIRMGLQNALKTKFPAFYGWLHSGYRKMLK